MLLEQFKIINVQDNFKLSRTWRWWTHHLESWHPHIPTYTRIYRHMTDILVYGGIWRVHALNATIKFSYFGIIFWCLIMPAFTTHANYMLCWIQNNENTVQNSLGMYLSYTCHELLYTCHSLVYPDMHQLYFESIFPYLWGSLGCLDLIGGTFQTHCMVFRSRNSINHCSDSDLQIMGI